MYSETCLNWLCSKVETLLRRTDTFDSVSFLYASLSRISKAKTCKEDTASDGWHFQSSDKKAPCLTRTQIKILGISEKQRIKLDIFVNFGKKKHFLYFETTFFYYYYFYFNLQFWRSATLLTRTFVSFIPSCSLQPTNNCFCATESDIDLETIFLPSMNYWFQCCDLH